MQCCYCYCWCCCHIAEFRWGHILERSNWLSLSLLQQSTPQNVLYFCLPHSLWKAALCDTTKSTCTILTAILLATRPPAWCLRPSPFHSPLKHGRYDTLLERAYTSRSFWKTWCERALCEVTWVSQASRQICLLWLESLFHFQARGRADIIIIRKRQVKSDVFDLDKQTYEVSLQRSGWKITMMYCRTVACWIASFCWSSRSFIIYDVFWCALWRYNISFPAFTSAREMTIKEIFRLWNCFCLFLLV